MVLICCETTWAVASTWNTVPTNEKIHHSEQQTTGMACNTATPGCIIARERASERRRFSPRILWLTSHLTWEATVIYKATKIVRALWLAERRVCMRVCKHGCDFKMFFFSCANRASTNLKKFSSSKLDKFTLFTHSFVGWNLENCYKQGVSFFFRWHLKREKSVFWKASFGKTRTDYVCKISCTRLSLLISALTKSFAFFLGKVILWKQ